MPPVCWRGEVGGTEAERAALRTQILGNNINQNLQPGGGQFDMSQKLYVDRRRPGAPGVVIDRPGHNAADSGRNWYSNRCDIVMMSMRPDKDRDWKTISWKRYPKGREIKWIHMCAPDLGNGEEYEDLYRYVIEGGDVRPVNPVQP